MAPNNSGNEAVARFQPFIDALSAHVALVDGNGEIVGVNAAWKHFADANRSRLDNYGIGLNYLRLLEGVTSSCRPGQGGCDDRDFAARAAAGLRAVLAGRSAKFQLEYPCDSPDEHRWFLLTITPLSGGGDIGAIVSHEDLTELKKAQEAAMQDARRLAESFGHTVDAISMFVEKRDPYTAGHQHQVAWLAEGIAGVLGLAADRRQGLRLAAQIHDIGKIAVPTDILTKPGRLSPPEFEIIRAHPDVAYEILAGIEFPWPVAEFVRQHHERLDGSGYPLGLQGEAIHLEARIICVADVFDAITAHRPYRPARSPAEGIGELVAGKGSRYDADVVDALLAFLDRHPA